MRHIDYKFRMFLVAGTDLGNFSKFVQDLYGNVRGPEDIDKVYEIPIYPRDLDFTSMNVYSCFILLLILCR